MGINRIKLANGTQNMKNLQDARMQQTYQQNIADNQAQKIRNQGVLQAARNKLQNFGNTLTSGVEGAIDYSMPIVNLGKGLLTGAGEPIITDTMRQDLIQRAEAKGGNSGALGYEDYGLEANTGGRFAGGITDIINDPQAFANAATVGRVTYDRDPETGEYSFGDTNYDFNVEDTDTGLGANLLKGINEGGLTGAISNLLTPSTAAAAEPSAMPQGSPGQLNPVPSGEQNYFPVLDIENPGRYLTEEEYTNRSLKEIAERDKPTMADVAGPSQAGVVPGFTKLKNPDGAPGNYNEFMYKGPDGQIYGAQTYGSISAGQYPDIYDPNKEMMASGGRVGFQEGTDPKLTARQVAEQNPELDAMRQKFFGTNYLDDIDQGNTGTVQYYSGLGNPNNLQFTQPVVETPAVDTSTPVVDTGGGGDGITGISTGNETGNTDFEQSLLDQGVGVQGAIGDPVVAPGEMLSTQAEMDAFNQIPVNREYGDPMNIGYGEGQVDPSLAAAVGGVDTTPIDLTGNIQVEDLSTPSNIGDFNITTAGDLPNQTGTIDGVTNIQDLPQVRTITDGQDNIYDAATGELLGNKYEYQGDFAPDEGTVFDDSSELGYQINQKFNSIKDAGAAGVDKLKDSLTALGGKVKEGFDNVIEIGGKTIDLGKSLASGVLSLATGIPGAGLLLNNLPERDPRQNALDDFYDDGAGSKYMDPSSPDYIPGMENYNTVSGGGLNMLTGGRLGDETTYGLQDAYQKRIDTIENTLAKKYSDGDYSGTELDERLADLKAAKAEEKALLDRVNSGLGVGVDMDSFTNPDDGPGYTPPEVSVETIDPGVLTEDDDDFVIGDETPVDINGNIIGQENIVTEPNINNNILADDRINRMTDDVDLDIFDRPSTAVDDYDFSDFDDGDTSVAADVPTGSDPINSFFDQVDNSAQEAADAQAAANQDSYRGGGGGDPDPAPESKPQQSGPTYSGMGSIGSGGGGGNNDSGGGGTHCCTAANERGDMTLLEVKKLRVWHRKQSKIWQKGYDVWGRVMADHLVSKYKWSSDRVRDFYNHKIYGKRTIGSTFADFCIYPMSIIIGCILTVMPPILGYQKHD